MIDKNKISISDYLILNDGTYCRVDKSWHGKSDSWLEVCYQKDGVAVRRSVELSEICEVAEPPE